MTFTEQPSSSAHLCRINCYNPLDVLHPRAPGPFYSYVGGYASKPDFSEGYWAVNKVSVTVSFAGTNPSVIGNNNWLAAGLFLEGMDDKTGGQDYAFYDVIVLDNEGFLYLDVGAWKENDDPISFPVEYHHLYETLGLLFDRCWLIGGLNYQNSVSLNMYWDPNATPLNATLSWSVTINGQTINPPDNSFNMSAALPDSAPLPRFCVGKHQFDPVVLPTWWCYFFQFGIMSPNQIERTGWQVTLSYPQYANTSSSPWQNVTTACLVDGYNSFLDATWMWGEQIFSGVDIASETGNVIIWSIALEPIGILAFFYDGHTATFDAPWVPLWSQWGFVQETLTTVSNGCGTTSPPSGTYTYNQGDNASIVATPSAGYTSGGYTHTYVFADWLLNGTLYTVNGIIYMNNTLILTMNANYILTAQFIEQVTGPPGGGGGGCPYVYTWSGTSFVKDNNLLPDSENGNGTDTKDHYLLQQPLVPLFNTNQKSVYSLQIREFESEQDYIDQVKLTAVDHSQGSNIAVTPEGCIVTYTNPAIPLLCVDSNGNSRLTEISRMGGNVSDPATYFQGYKGYWLILDFGRVTVTNANLILRDDWKCDDVCIDVQVPGGNDGWQTVDVLHPRDFWAMEAVNMTAYLPTSGNFIVRLLWTSTHRLDYVGLDTSAQTQVLVTSASPILAVHSTMGDVTAKLLFDDENCVKLVNSQQVTLAFTLPNKVECTTRDFILFTDGYYCTMT